MIGQRTKNTLDGRDAEYHGYPILIGDLIAQLQGAAYVARGSVHNAGAVARTQKMFKRAFESQVAGEGFSFVEVLTMCPTGWFIPTAEGPGYMPETLGEVHIMGELKVDGRVRTTEELHAENVAKQREVDDALARGGLKRLSSETDGLPLSARGRGVPDGVPALARRQPARRSRRHRAGRLARDRRRPPGPACGRGTARSPTRGTRRSPGRRNGAAAAPA